MDNSSHDATLVGLLTETQAALRLYVHSLLPGDPSAHDVAQRTSLLLWQKRSEFVIGTNFKAWAFSVARYEVLHHRKQQVRDSRLVFGLDLESQLSDDLLEREVQPERRHAALMDCLTKLRAADRELLLYRYAPDAGTLEDYSARSGRSVGGLKVTLHRLRNLLLGCIRKQLTKPIFLK
jgi:RNA polymerase sigma-70 factor (ECF subfamily)